MTNISAAAAAQPERAPRNFKKRVLTWDEACAMWAHSNYQRNFVAEVGQYGQRHILLGRNGAGMFAVRVRQNGMTRAEFFLGTDGVRDVWHIPLRRYWLGKMQFVGSRVAQGFTPASADQVRLGLKSHRRGGNRMLHLSGNGGVFRKGMVPCYVFDDSGVPSAVLRNRFAAQLSDAVLGLPEDTSTHRQQLAVECARVSLAAADEVFKLADAFPHVRVTATAERVISRDGYRVLANYPEATLRVDPHFSACIEMHVPEPHDTGVRLIALRVIAHGRRLAALRYPCFVLSAEIKANSVVRKLQWGRGDSLGAWLLAHTCENRDIIESSMTLEPLLKLMREWCAAGVVVPV